MRELIKNYFQGYSKKGISNALPKFIKNNPEVEKYLNNLLIENSNWENIRNIVYEICFDEQLKKCKTCRKEMKYSKGINHDYCSHKCSTSSKEVQEKYKRTNLEKYGCENPAQSKEVREKVKRTCIKRYNCENPMQSKEFQEKVRHTNLEKYGCEIPFQNKEIKEKIKQTCLEKYGCEYPIQNEEIQKKVKQTCIEKYSVEHPMQSKEFQEKVRHTNLERLGVEYSSQNKEVQKKYKQTNLERYGCTCILQNKEVKEKVKQIQCNNSYDNFILSFVKYGITPLFPKEEYTGYDKTYRWKCKCGNEFEQKIYKTSHVEECPYLPRCWNCYPRMSGESRVELELLDFVKQYYPNAHKDNKLIKPKELDIVIDELKLAIEFNGDYWHSTEFYLEHHDNLNEYYGRHLNKILEANKKGYRLIHIGESDWINNKEKIKDKLIDILQGKENLNFTEDKIKLKRSWYNSIEIPGYKLVEEISPEMINRNGFNVENCGYLVYIKNI